MLALLLKLQPHIQRLLFRLKVAILRLMDRFSPGWGLRKRFPWLDTFISRIMSWTKKSKHVDIYSWAKPKDLIAKVRFHSLSFRLLLSKREPLMSSGVSYELLTNGVWEPNTSEVFYNSIQPGQVVIDIGANIGYHSILAGKLVGPSGKVLAFEPDPYSFELLSKNLFMNGLEGIVIPINKAAGEANSLKRLFLSEENSGDHHLFDSKDGRSSIEVECVRLDDYLLKNFAPLVQKISAVKIDIQGYEAKACQGMTGLFSKNSPTLFIEYEPGTLTSAGSSASELLLLLEKSGYVFHEIKEHATINFLSPMTFEQLLRVPSTEGFNLFCKKDGTATNNRDHRDSKHE